MTEPEDRESKPTPPSSGGPYLSPRLREKLDESKGGDDEDFLKPTFPTGLVVTVVLIVALAAGGWWMIRAGNEKAKAEQAREARAAAAARAVEVADSLAAVHRADSLAVVARADSIAFAKLPKSQQRRILAERARAAAAPKGTAAPGASATGAAAAAPAPKAGAADSASSEPAAPREKGPFSIDAGQYIDEARANEVAAALKTKTPLAVQVVNVTSGSESTYHVMLGSFATRAAAEKAAGKVFESGIAEQAAVVPLPKSP